MVQKRPKVSLSPHGCIMCKGEAENIDPFFLHCSASLKLWHKMFMEAWPCIFMVSEKHYPFGGEKQELMWSCSIWL